MSSSVQAKRASAPPGDSRWKRWGISAAHKAIKASDWAGGYANAGAAKIGAERFWPQSNDMPLELAKCERILRAFTAQGLVVEKEETVKVEGGEGWMKKKRKVLRKVPPSVIHEAKGIVIYTAMRSGIAPFGGAGGGGLVMGRLADGSWSAPSALSPNNLSAGLMLGFDIFDVILILRTQKALDSFRTHKVTIGSELAVAAGPVGAGGSAEMGIERAPIFSYVRSRGLYMGAEVMAQLFIDRFDENERFYCWPGIKAGDILSGRVRVPPEARSLHAALRDAETGRAQGSKLEDDLGVTSIAHLSSLSELELGEGETLRLPPTPEQLKFFEDNGIISSSSDGEDEEDEEERRKREEAYELEPPPVHRDVRQYWTEGKGRVVGFYDDESLTNRKRLVMIPRPRPRSRTARTARTAATAARPPRPLPPRWSSPASHPPPATFPSGTDGETTDKIREEQGQVQPGGDAADVQSPPPGPVRLDDNDDDDNDDDDDNGEEHGEEEEEEDGSSISSITPPPSLFSESSPPASIPVTPITPYTPATAFPSGEPSDETQTRTCAGKSSDGRTSTTSEHRPVVGVAEAADGISPPCHKGNDDDDDAHEEEEEKWARPPRRRPISTAIDSSRTDDSRPSSQEGV